MHNENFVYLTFEDTILDSGHCLLDLLEFPNDNKTPAISFNHLLEHKRCEISRNDQSKYQMPLLHSLTCPARIFARENHIVLRLERPIRLAGCAIITSSDSKVLMTRRTENLRIFPKS